MEKNEKCAVIKYLHMKELSAQQIYLDTKEVLGDDVPSQATVYRWTGALQWGRQSTETEHRSGPAGLVANFIRFPAVQEFENRSRYE